MTTSIAPSARPATVLFAHREGNARFAYHSAALNAGLRVELASDGQETILLAHVFRPDVIVLDEDVSILSGSEVIPQLQASRTTRDIPLVLVAGATRPSRLACHPWAARVARSSSAEYVLTLARMLVGRRR
jgi:CheY-like chemotaxis protein